MITDYKNNLARVTITYLADLIVSAKMLDVVAAQVFLARQTDLSSDERRALVKLQLRHLPLSEWQLNLLIELSIAYRKVSGYDNEQPREQPRDQ